MKEFILIIILLLSSTLYSLGNKKVDKSNIELGVSMGLPAGSGASLRYSFISDFSIKLSGYILNSTIHEGYLYEARISAIYSVYENKIFELYFINGFFKTNMMTLDSQTDENTMGLASGFGFKLNINDILPSYNKPHGNKRVSFFLELQENITDSDIKKIEFEPNVNIGILFNF